MNGYPSHIIKRSISKGEIIYRKQSKTEKEIEKGKTPIYFRTTYYGQESLVFASRLGRMYKKLLPNVNIQFTFKKNLSLKRIFLLILKGKSEQKSMKNLVYSIPCLNCNKVYIGDTSGMKEKRMAEHRAEIKTFASDSRMGGHIEDQKHSFDFT